MRFLRTLLCSAFFLVFGIGGLLFSAALCLPLPKPTMRAMLRVQFRFFVWAARATRLFVVEVSDADRAAFRSFRGSVIVSNHISLIDIVILVSLAGDSVCVTKGSVGGNPFLRMIARKTLIVNEGPVEVLGKAAQYLADGVNVIVFPEGTRTPADAPLHRFQRGAAHLALRTGAPVETVFMESDPPVLGKRQPWWDVGATTIRYSVRHRGRIGVEAFRGTDYIEARKASRELTESMRRKVFGT